MFHEDPFKTIEQLQLTVRPFFYETCDAKSLVGHWEVEHPSGIHARDTDLSTAIDVIADELRQRGITPPKPEPAVNAARGEKPMHTAKPWHCTKGPGVDGFFRILGNNGEHIASLPSDLIDGEAGPGEANTTLIVQAVNAHDALLEAVQRLGRLAGMMADPTIDCTEIDWTKALVDAETAIAEATGEPHISR